VLNHDDAQLNVCSSFNTALSSQHSNVKLNNPLESAAFLPLVAHTIIAMLNYDDEQLDVCSKTALSSQHSTYLKEPTASVAWAWSLCLKLQTDLAFLLCSIKTMSNSMIVHLAKQPCHHNTQLTDMNQLHL